MCKCLKTNSIILLLTLGLLCPVNSATAQGNSDETKRVIMALFDAFNRHDTGALVALYSEDAQILSPGDIEPRIGKAAVREIYDSHFDNIPGVHDEVQNIVAMGDQGSVEFIASWDQPTEDDPNARQSLRIASFIKVNDGLIIQDITYFDRLELAEKMKIEDAN